MEILKVRQGDENWNKTITYTESGSWENGHKLAKRMKENHFFDFESVFVAIEEGEILGYCTFITQLYPHNDKYSPWITSIFVDEKGRGKKISGLLIEKAINHAKENKITKVYISCHITGLYEKYGFTQVDTFMGKDNKDQLIYVKEI